MNKYKIFIGLLILNFLFTTVVFAADPYYVKQWYLKNIEADLEKGQQLSKALSIFPKVFPKIVISMIASGEEIGNLSKALETVGDQMEKNYLLKKKIQGAMILAAANTA